MKSFILRLSVALLTFTVGVVGVTLLVVHRYRTSEELQAINTAFSRPLQIREDAPGLSPPPESPISRVDFNNFTYPWPEGFSDPDGPKATTTFRLRNGELPNRRFSKYGVPLDVGVGLSDVMYDDLTGDGNEEAILIMGVVTGGSSIPNMIYIYTLHKGRPKLLWCFTTGDRADGGFKRIKSENGELVIELEGKNKYIGGDLYAEDETKQGDCCPTMYTRARYKWNGRRFVMQGKPESFPLHRKL